MAFMVASSDILTQAYVKAPAPLGQALYYKRGKFVCVLSKDTIASGDCVAFKASIDPALFQVTKTSNTSAVTAGLAIGFACAASVTGEYFFAQVGGVENDASPVIVNDGGDFAVGDTIVPDLSGTDGQVRKGGSTEDHLRLGNVTTAITGTSMSDWILVDRFAF